MLKCLLRWWTVICFRKVSFFFLFVGIKDKIRTAHVLPMAPLGLSNGSKANHNLEGDTCDILSTIMKEEARKFVCAWFVSSNRNLNKHYRPLLLWRAIYLRADRGRSSIFGLCPWNIWKHRNRTHLKWCLSPWWRILSLHFGEDPTWQPSLESSLLLQTKHYCLILHQDHSASQITFPRTTKTTITQCHLDAEMNESCDNYPSL